jgi:uncharacterized protein YxjI
MVRHIVFDPEPHYAPVAHVQYEIPSEAGISPSYPNVPVDSQFNVAPSAPTASVMLSFNAPPPYTPPMYPIVEDMQQFVLPAQDRLQAMNPSYVQQQEPSNRRQSSPQQYQPPIVQHAQNPDYFAPQQQPVRHRNSVTSPQQQPAPVRQRPVVNQPPQQQPAPVRHRHSVATPQPQQPVVNQHHHHHVPSNPQHVQYRPVVLQQQPVVNNHQRNPSNPHPNVVNHQRNPSAQPRNSTPVQTVRRYKIKNVGAHSRSIQMAIEENGYLLYNCIFRFDDHIQITDNKNAKIATISKSVLSLHPTFHVSMGEKKIGKCTKRFKWSTTKKKINYTKHDTGEVIKLVGTFNGTMYVNKNEKKIGTLTVPNNREYILEIDSHPTDLFHILMLLLIMIEVKHTE